MTNQSGIGRNLLSADMLGQIHVRMIDYVQQYGGKIQSILFCPHLPDDGCECRKPKSGMYQELANRISVSFKDVYSVGDSLRDLQAAKAAGAVPILVKTGNGRKTLQQMRSCDDGLENTSTFNNLAGFVDALLLDKL
jgi:D-glycero-D-manno-heptose 1,7-bisphosphate phosphatase